MATAPPRAETVHSAYAADLRHALDEVRRGVTVWVPRSLELHRRRPRSHFHATPELFIQTGGGTDFVCPGESFRLRTGQLCLIPRGVPHAETPINLRRPYGIVVCMHARDDFILNRAREIGGAITGRATMWPASPRGRDAFQYLDAITTADRLPAAERPRFTTALLEAFLLTLLSELECPPAASAPGSRLVAEATTLARTHLANPALSVAQIAAALACSPDHLSRIFHRERGLTFSAWVTSERMALAGELLTQSHYNISEVGWACGYNAPSYFIRVFQRFHGLTPRAFRLTRTDA